MNPSWKCFNFGPNSNEDKSVLDIVKKMSEYWENVIWDIEDDTSGLYESGLLKLNCDKARSLLDWHAFLDFDTTIRFTAEWYKEFYKNSKMLDVTHKQIREFIEIARKQNIYWLNE